MKSAATFLTAEWRKLLMINYRIDAEVLSPYLPAKTSLDPYKGEYLVSLVGFLFLNTRVFRLAIPFHRNFEEFNLRFYVSHASPGGSRRGVVFINEIVPAPGIPLVANTMYREHYICRPMRSAIQVGDDLEVSYGFKMAGQWNSVYARAGKQPVGIPEDSLEEFITEHYYGYNRWNAVKTLEYEVTHPRWEMYPVKDVKVDISFDQVYPAAFTPYLEKEPHSVLLAEGSPITVKRGKVI
jgi:uncharacterized protein